jgi:DNA invertase Pin-like site-specific DNA recombinase
MMKVGYARTSTVEQEAGLEAQERDLQAEGCEKIFSEHASASKQRDELEKALDFAREGDCFIVCKLDRLARSVINLNQIIERLKKKGVRLKILNIGLDTETPTGKMMLTMLAAVAEFEREIMLERQKEGIEKAKKSGKFKGRPPMPEEIKNAIIDFASTNVSKVWISKKLNISIASVYRVLGEDKAKAPA